MFQSTPPRGGRPLADGHNVSLGNVSIHAPTRGATLHAGAVRPVNEVSIHLQSLRDLPGREKMEDAGLS